MNVFKEFYSALFNLPETWDGVTEHVKRLDTRHAGVLWQFELMHGKLVSLLLHLKSKANDMTTRLRKLSSTSPSGTSFPTTQRRLDASNASLTVNRGISPILIQSSLVNYCEFTHIMLLSGNKAKRRSNGVGDIEKEAGRHSYVSFSYTKERGPYLTLYYAPKLEREQK